MNLTIETVKEVMQEFFDEERVYTEQYEALQLGLMKKYGEFITDLQKEITELKSRLNALEGNTNSEEDMRDIST